MEKLKERHKVNRLRSHTDKIKQASRDGLRLLLSDVRRLRDDSSDEVEVARISRILVHGEDVLARGVPAEADRFIRWLEAFQDSEEIRAIYLMILTATLGDQLSTG